MMNLDIFYGIVEDRNDPEELCRVRVRIFGIHSEDKLQSDMFGIPTEDLPWAVVMQGTDSAALNGIGKTSKLLPGTQVCGFFRDLHKQSPVIIGTIHGTPEASQNTSKGFNDPNGIYPKAAYLNESDINRLARNKKISETIVQTKINNKITGIPLAISGSWDEPETPYNTQYPYNQVLESESGHIIEIDDTPSAERLHTYHKSGTFEEIHPNGDKVIKIVGKNYTLIADDENVRVGGDCNLTVIGTCNLKANIGNVDIPTTNWKGNIVHQGDVTQTGNRTQTGNEAVTGNRTQTGNDTLTGTQAITGNMTASGTVTATTDVVGGGKSLKTHTHTDTPGLGAGTTSAPN